MHRAFWFFCVQRREPEWDSLRKKMKRVRKQTDLSKRTFARDPVEFEVVKIDLTSEVDGLGWGATHTVVKVKEGGGSGVVAEGKHRL